ncbi:MAG: ABC transporter ATP-binding protein [Candidatus Schekmanbacteria bacterium]|nr:ABC transporter ATP-binding protein [Candidatus Schekmanbacteria bacterium]
MRPAVEVINVTKIYPNGVKAIDGVSFSVGQGEVFGILGANGAGKTSLIKVITTLLKPTSGSVKLLGLDVQKNPAEGKNMLGVVSQDINLDTYLTVKQNLCFQCRYFGISGRDSEKRIAEWMELLGISDVAEAMIYTLSGGTKRKVMVARAFITDPKVLILDEPTNGLDPLVREVVWEQIIKFRQSGKTVLLSTHHFEEARKLCDRMGVIHRGKMIACDHDLTDIENIFKSMVAS